MGILSKIVSKTIHKTKYFLIQFQYVELLEITQSDVFYSFSKN